MTLPNSYIQTLYVGKLHGYTVHQ